MMDVEGGVVEGRHGFRERIRSEAGNKKGHEPSRTWLHLILYRTLRKIVHDDDDG
jgi:hypothetical protein